VLTYSNLNYNPDLHTPCLPNQQAAVTGIIKTLITAPEGHNQKHRAAPCEYGRSQITQSPNAGEILTRVKICIGMVDWGFPVIHVWNRLACAPSGLEMNELRPVTQGAALCFC
jgi:hypothetical protein